MQWSRVEPQALVEANVWLASPTVIGPCDSFGGGEGEDGTNMTIEWDDKEGISGMGRD